MQVYADKFRMKSVECARFGAGFCFVYQSTDESSIEIG